MTTAQNISENELEQAIVSSLEHIVEDEGFITHEKHIRAISTNGGNYIGDLYEVDIKGQSANGDKETNLFIKRAKTDFTSSFMKVQEFHEREVMMYQVIGKLYTQFMDDAKIPKSERFTLVKCYEVSDEFIIIENLAVKDFVTLGRTTPLPIDFAELAIKQLAKFHALSFVLQRKQPDHFNTHLKLPVPLKFTSDYYKILKESFDISYKLLDEDSEKRVRTAYDEIADMKRYYEKSLRCLCHGDYRSNNMLIKKKGGKIVDLIPVDYQLVHYGNPMNDFWYLLVVHTDQEFRRQHLTTLKELYYDTLTQFIKYFDIDVSSVYPREEFELDYKTATMFGLESSVALLSILFVSDDTVQDIRDIDSFNTKVNLQDGAKDRIQGIVEDYINWGII